MLPLPPALNRKGIDDATVAVRELVVRGWKERFNCSNFIVGY